MSKTFNGSQIVKINGMNVPLVRTNRHGRIAWILAEISPERILVPIRFRDILKAEIKVREIEMNGIKAWKRMPMNEESLMTIEIKID